MTPQPGFLSFSLKKKKKTEEPGPSSLSEIKERANPARAEWQLARNTHTTFHHWHWRSYFNVTVGLYWV